ncbi:MAG: hypothetical protein PUE08_01945 [Eubacteriales bacterium]|nr:hypothetical protein [Eubacteriales bacterium]
MRINEYNNISEFISQYSGTWSPSNEQWLGLEFRYKDEYYRFDSGDNFSVSKIIFSDSDTYPMSSGYEPLIESETLESLLKKKMISNLTFADVIMADETEILAKD